MSPDSAESRTLWLAAYPKSGSTWVRLLWAELLQGASRASDRVLRVSGCQPHDTAAITDAFGVDLRLLTASEFDLVRAEHGNPWRPTKDPGALRKTHERYRLAADGRPVFPKGSAAGVVVLVRDPRDVACSWASHFGVGLDEAVDAICTPGLAWPGKLVFGAGSQVLGSWSEHFRSWRSCADFPLLTLRYEDLLADPAAALADAATWAGLQATPADIRAAVDATAFARLRHREAESGFAERPDSATGPFFRRGVAGGWQDELMPDQLRRIEQAAGDLMAELGYDLATASPRSACRSDGSEPRRGH